jgi:hypothetical protein
MFYFQPMTCGCRRNFGMYESELLSVFMFKNIYYISTNKV